MLIKETHGASGDLTETMKQALNEPPTVEDAQAIFQTLSKMKHSYDASQTSYQQNELAEAKGARREARKAQSVSGPEISGTDMQDMQRQAFLKQDGLPKTLSR